MDKARLRPGIGDVLVAVVMFVMGFLFWEWELLFYAGGGLGGFLFFLLDTLTAFAYLHWRGVRQNPKSIAAFVVVLLGMLPFLLYDQRDISILNCMFEVCAYLLWLGFSCGTMIGEKLSGFLAIDAARQWFIVPFSNFGKLFSSFGYGLGGGTAAPAPAPAPASAPVNPAINPAINPAATMATDSVANPAATRVIDLAAKPEANSTINPEVKPEVSSRSASSRARSILLLILGLVIALPVIFAIISLLASSDDGFGEFVAKFSGLFSFTELPGYVLSFILGIPVACYIFGAIFGNALHNHSNPVPLERADEVLGTLHAIPRIALYAPLILLVLIFITYFITMAAYLFSAFNGELPTSYTYAQYARKGFFELCAVATINLVLLAFTYLFARRQIHEYPQLLRLLTGAISLCTCLLIFTAMSKMLLYIGSYGLTRLRIYTLWFMVLLLLVFIIVLIWHIKSYKLGRFLVIVPLVCSLTLFLADTDGIIANYNVGQYLSGQTEKIDADMLVYLSDGVLPALYDLEANAPDQAVRTSATDAIAAHLDGSRSMLYDPKAEAAFYNWNIQSQLAKRG